MISIAIVLGECSQMLKMRMHAVIGQTKLWPHFGVVMEVYDAVCESSLDYEFEL